MQIERDIFSHQGLSSALHMLLQYIRYLDEASSACTRGLGLHFPAAIAVMVRRIIRRGRYAAAGNPHADTVDDRWPTSCDEL